MARDAVLACQTKRVSVFRFRPLSGRDESAVVPGCLEAAKEDRIASAFRSNSFLFCFFIVI